MKRVKESYGWSFTIFSIRFELWYVIEGKRLSVDIRTTRYIFKPFGYCGKCSTLNLI